MEAERYNRQIILKGFGQEAQQRLAEAHVLVIGAGGLGCPALQYLAASGVGHIGIVDDDTVSLSNLHRQILFGTNDIGKPKVEVAVRRLKELNPEIKISAHSVRVQKANILGLLKEYDLIFDGTDNFESRYLINDACALLQKPLVFAAVSDYEGQLSVFNVKDAQNQSTNYRDFFPVQPGAGEIPNCAENGVLGVLPGIIGMMAAAEIIKLVTGIGKPLVNKLLHYNLLSQEQYEMSISPADNYLLPKTEQELLTIEYESNCATTGYTEIDPIQMQALQNEGSAIVIDVRERHETPLLNTNIFVQCPMSEFEAFLQKEIPEKNVIFLCQHGIRSIAAAEAFAEKYGNAKNVYNLKGGIVKWRDHFKM